MSEPSDKFDALVAYIQDEGRICPQPQRWKELWELLPNKERTGARWKPSLPLILAAWWNTTNLDKMTRLREHIEYAAEHGVLDEVDSFIRRLSKDDWHTTKRNKL